MEKTVIELFAGVGGFRVGLNEVNKIDKNGRAIEKKNFEFLWANQWEPSTRIQPAYECYKMRFNSLKSELSNEDISQVDKRLIPKHTLLCGGFPCQDYSVARSLSNEKGIEGKKGVLWWQILNILQEKKTPFILLENVDRLLKSPVNQRGRDFAIMLRCLNDLGYFVEWRVINAADYGFPQRRRRVFIFAYKNSTKYGQSIFKRKKEEILKKEGLFAKCFPVLENLKEIIRLDIVSNFIDLLNVSNNFSGSFKKSGLMIEGNIYTADVTPNHFKVFKLKKILETNVSEDYYLDDEKIEKFDYLRGSKKISRIASNGTRYTYSEGKMSPFDSLELPGRTMLTSEGTTNRSTHIIRDDEAGRLRFLTPIECERLNQFPDNWTETMNRRKRYFMMGNALVTGIVKKLGSELSKIIEEE